MTHATSVGTVFLLKWAGEASKRQTNPSLILNGNRENQEGDLFGAKAGPMGGVNRVGHAAQTRAF